MMATETGGVTDLDDSRVNIPETPAEYDDAIEDPEVRLKDGIDLNDLRTGQGTVFEVEDDFEAAVSKEYFNPEMIYSATSGHMPGFGDSDPEDDDPDDETSPFEKLSSKMTNLTEDGGVKKRILKQGVGGDLQKGYVVKVHYHAYTEYADEPHDSTTMRNQPKTVILGKGDVIMGFDIALLSMRKKEQSQFLIQHQYAYGEQGCEPRIPKSATILYNIEVLDAAESAGADEFFMLDREERRELDLKKLLKYVRDELTKGKKFWVASQHRQAADRFKACLRILKERNPKDEMEEIEIQKEEIRASRNLAVVSLKQRSLGQVIFHANNVLAIRPKDPKALYLKGKALMMKGDYVRSGQLLKDAQDQLPGDADIAEALKQLDREMDKWKQVERKMCVRMFAYDGEQNKSDKPTADGETGKSVEDVENESEVKGQSSSDRADMLREMIEPDSVTETFKEKVKEALSYFVENESLLEMPYPRKGLTMKEVAAILDVVKEMGLHYKNAGEGDNAHLYLMKTKPS